MGTKEEDGELPQTDAELYLPQGSAVKPLAQNLGGAPFSLFEPDQHLGQGIFSPAEERLAQTNNLGMLWNEDGLDLGSNLADFGWSLIEELRHTTQQQDSPKEPATQSPKGFIASFLQLSNQQGQETPAKEDSNSRATV